MNHLEHKILAKKQNDVCEHWENILAKFPKSGAGLVSDETLKNPIYIGAKKEFQKAFKILQDINKFGVINFKKEIQRENRIKMMALVNYDEATFINIATGNLYNKENLKIVGNHN